MIIKTILSFIKDFKDYLLIRRLNRLVELDESHKRVIFSYDKEIEKELDAIVLHKLAELMVGGEITPEIYR